MAQGVWPEPDARIVRYSPRAGPPLNELWGTRLDAAASIIARPPPVDLRVNPQPENAG